MMCWMFFATRARAIGSDLARIATWLSAYFSAVVLTIAGVASAVSVYYGSFSASGSDPSGYLSHALMLSRGQLSNPEPLSSTAAWPSGGEILVPLGWRSAREAGAHVPSYPIGLPLLMAPAYSIGGTLAACLIVPLSFFLAIWATGALGRRVADSSTGILAAAWLASSPIALLMAMQPMTDVPVTAAWLMCWVLITRGRNVGMPGSAGVGFSRVVAGGIAAALAILIRPNLAPLAAIPALWVLVSNDRQLSVDAAFGPPSLARSHASVHLRQASAGQVGETSTPHSALRTPHLNVRAAAFFSVPAAIAGFVLAYLHWRWFGSPLRSGHGTAEDFFSLAYVAPNAAVYLRWLLETHGPWLLLAPASWFAGSMMRWLLAFAATVIAAYLIFGVFDVWIYLRFLLPALAIAMIAVAWLVTRALRRFPAPARAPIFVAVVMMLVASNVIAARAHGVFRFGGVESRAALAGRYLREVLPADAVVIAGEQSGSVRYYTQHSIVRWDAIPASGLDAVLTRLRSQGRDVWIALDVWEEEPFRRRFPASAAGALDWKPRMEAGTGMLTRAWRVREREAFMRGERIVTDRLP